jgi:hypothetical protein
MEILRMKKLFIIALMMGFYGLAFGGTTAIDTRGLSQEQINSLVAQRDKMKSPENLSATVRNEAAAWADLGSNIGTALVSAAKEVGVAANEFSGTQLGKIVTVIVVYKVMGKDILGVLVGSFILVFGFGMAVWLLITKRFHDCKYETRPVLKGLFNRRYLTASEISSNLAEIKIFTAGAFIVLSTIVGLNCIF